MIKILFGSVRNLTDIVDNVVEDFYLCTENCENELDNLLLDIPLEWGVETQEFAQLLRDNIFQDNWYQQCETHFRELIQANL